jgi:hypothetical protein
MAAFRLRRRDQRGVVSVHLMLVLGFAFFAVIMLSRTTLAARAIDDHVRIIVTEVGPGSNVSRLEETQQLNSIGRTAEGILAASKPLAGQTQAIAETVRSVDGTAAAIVGNANEINSSVRSIGATTSALRPVVAAINGQGTSATDSSGVAGINLRADALRPEVDGISRDLATVAGAVGGAGGIAEFSPAHTIESHVRSINCALASPTSGLVGTAGSLLGGILPMASGPVACP